MASEDIVPASTFRDWSAEYDRAVIDTAARREAPVLLHAHGYRIHWDVILEYQAAAFSWHDRGDGASLSDVRRRSGRAVLGGLDERALVAPDTSLVIAQLDDCLAQTAGLGWIASAGCVAPQAFNPINLLAIAEHLQQAPSTTHVAPAGQTESC